MKENQFNIHEDTRHLTHEAAQEIDRALEATEGVRHMVASLPEEEPTLAWRSALSERIHQEASKRDKRRRWNFVWRPFAGVALASALAVVMLNRVPNSGMVQPSSSRSLEASLAQAHQDAMAASEVTSYAPVVAVSDEAREELHPTWNEVDLEAL